MKTIQVQRSEDLLITLPEGWAKEGEKVSITEKDGAIFISKLRSIEVDLDKELFYRIALLAHEKDVTFNEMCNEILAEMLEREENARK